MGKEADQPGDAGKPIKPPAVQDGGDHTTTNQVEDDRARLSQIAWFGEGPGTPADAKPTNVANPKEVNVTPIQTVLTADAGGPVQAEVKEKAKEQSGGSVEAAPRQDIEKLNQAIVEADRSAPQALKTLTEGRGATLDLVGKFVKGDAAGKSDPNDQALEGLKTQEIKQVKEYIDYLRPGTTRADLGSALIAKGDDASVREGERKLVEAVQARPDLIFHPNFRAQVMDAYTKMAQFRKDNGLEPWKSDIDISSMTAKGGAREPWADKSGDHFDKANDLFFNSGVKAALPEFQQAISAADETAAHNQDKSGNERLGLFVEGLKADRAIAQGQVTGESTTEMEKRRVDIWQKQVDNYVEDAVGSRARMNVGLAMVASGDPEMLAQGKQQLLDAVSKHPGLVYAPGLAAYSNEFTERLFGAYKANVENAKPGTADGAAPSPADKSNTVMDPVAREDLQAGYDQNKIRNAPLPEGNEKKVEGYGWDKATDIGLPIATMGLMLYTGRRQYKNYQRARAERESNFELEPTDRASTQKDVITRQGPQGEEKLEIKGRAKDGQVVAKNLTEGADTSASTRPPIDPPKDFNPAKGKYAEYQPVKVDGKKYFLNENGEAFEQRSGKLYPTDQIRGLTTPDVAGTELRALPQDMQRTPFDLHGRSLTAMGTLADGRVVLQNNTTGGAPQRDTIDVPKGVDPFKGEFNNFQHQRLAGRDYFVSPDNKVYTMLEPERRMMEVESVVVKPQDAVYKATGAPGSSTAERALNKQVNDILEPLRV